MNKTVPMSELTQIIKEKLENGAEVVIGISGSSMEPMLKHRRDSVCIVKLEETKINIFDIALYVRTDGTFIIHRIVGKNENGFIFAGDNQLSREYQVTMQQILGIVKSFRRNGVYISCSNIFYKAYCRIWISRFSIAVIPRLLRRALKSE